KITSFMDKKNLHNQVAGKERQNSMIKFMEIVCILAVIHLAAGCCKMTHLSVGYKNPQIEYSGRIDTTRIDGADLYWSGTSVKINFEGTTILALMEDETGDNYYNVIVDGAVVSMLRPSTIREYHQLASKLDKGKHTVEIFKRTEWDRGRTTFFGFQIRGDSKLLPKAPPKKRKIEFYGNSITAGYAVEDYSGGDSPEGTFTNNYLSYAAIIARHFNAEYRCICKSGIGIIISWFPLTMPELYDRLIPEDSTSKWDFGSFTPDIVVINLLQNDSWLVEMPEEEEFKKKFGDTAPDEDFIISSYKNFVSRIRKHYPEANIICALGNMDATREESEWPDYIDQAVDELNDPKIHTHFIPFKNTPGHPDIKEQNELANSLIRFIDNNIEW
ncbi:MAG TPA: SGNH/GDSL hydrolase family protein, partial [Bacteroidales bacterium]|nr:SGNH/GDSL hydrolase family protein [Bacteroidales bacterium]